MSLTTGVDAERVEVRLRLLVRLGRSLPLAEIAGVEVHENLSRHVPGMVGRALWLGMRRVPGVATYYNLRARGGVTITPRAGERLVIGSDRPYELAAALRGDESSSAAASIP